MKYVLAVLLAFLLIGCTAPNETMRIGGVFHLTGPAAVWGQGELNAAQLAVEEINNNGGVNGKNLELVVEDSQTDLSGTVSSFNKLIEVDQVVAAIGPTWFGQVAAPIAENKKFVIISPSTGVTISREKFFFNLWPTEKQEILPLVEHMREQDVNTAAVVYTTNDWSTSMKDNFLQLANENDIAVIETFGTDAEETDFRTIITQLAELEVDAVYAPFAFYPPQGAFSNQREQLDMTIPLYSSSGTENPELLSSFPSIEGTIYAYPDREDRELAFQEKYLQRYDETYSTSSAYAYDAVYVLVEALQDKRPLADAVAAIRDYQGVSNTITFENGRVVEKTHSVKIVRNGAFTHIDSTI